MTPEFFFFFSSLSWPILSYFLAFVQLLSHVQLFATPWTLACQAPLSSTVSWSLLKFMFIELVMLPNHLILCCPFSFCLQFFSASGSFAVSQLFASDAQSIGASASVSVLPMNIQGGFPLELTGFISLQSKELPRFFSSITIQKSPIFFVVSYFLKLPSVSAQIIMFFKCPDSIKTSSAHNIQTVMTLTVSLVLERSFAI